MPIKKGRFKFEIEFWGERCNNTKIARLKNREKSRKNLKETLDRVGAKRKVPRDGMLSADEAARAARFCSASAATRGYRSFRGNCHERSLFYAMKTRKLALNAVLAAMCAALGAFALDLNSIKITFESFPILLGALLFGPLDGLAVGFVGTLLYQLLRYGVSVTMPLWILPYALAGLMTGFYAKRRGFSLTVRQTVGIVVAAEVLVTALNTLVMYIDAKLYGYWFPGFISAMLLPRGAVCIVKAVVFGLVLPKLCARVRRALPGEGETTHGA